MGIIQIPRVMAAALRGTIKRRLSPLDPRVGTADVPHIYTSRAGIFDVDLNGHMNNAAYLQHAEFARWEWGAYEGFLARGFETKTFFILSASMIRFRREIPPMKRFDIESRFVGLDDRNMWVYQTFHHHDDDGSSHKLKQLEANSSRRGKILAQILTRAVFAQPARGVVNPHSWLEENSMYSKEVLDGLANQNKDDEMKAMFDEKAKRFETLEEIFKNTAASYDEKVPK